MTKTMKTIEQVSAFAKGKVVEMPIEDTVELSGWYSNAGSDRCAKSCAVQVAYVANFNDEVEEFVDWFCEEDAAEAVRSINNGGWGKEYSGAHKN